MALRQRFVYVLFTSRRVEVPYKGQRHQWQRWREIAALFGVVSQNRKLRKLVRGRIVLTRTTSKEMGQDLNPFYLVFVRVRAVCSTSFVALNTTDGRRHVTRCTMLVYQESNL